ncbi:MAG: DUF1292 domain-containing protein, partial [Oscillospiraceae bacterium]|nr:DUF1292 domain-containing protein [Oscillospiraceae bacterium]
MQENNFDDDMEMTDSEDVDVYTLTDEDGTESEFELLGRHDENGQSYVALAPVDAEESDEEEGSFIVLKVIEEDGEEIFVTIEDDDEFDRIADIFEDELMQDI